MKKAALKLFTFLHKYMNKNKSIIGICSLVLVLGYVASSVFAEPSQDTLDRARLIQVKTELENNSREYVLLATEHKRNQEYCTLAFAQEKQMSALNAESNAKRTEVQFLESKLHPIQPKE